MPPKVNPEFPRWASCLGKPARYRVFHGGRGSSKSWTVSQYLVARAARQRHKILCAREIQLSIRDSSKRLIEATIDRLGISNEFEITNTYIRHKHTGSEFIFWGLHDGAEKLKSAEGITLVWVEEANTVSQRSMDNLHPTIRAPNSEIIYTFNPGLPTDPVYNTFVAGDPPPNSQVVQVNYHHNPWFPDVLKDQMEWDRANDADKYRHVWEGEPVKHSEAQVFYGKWSIAPCPEPSGDTPLYHGVDWGFASDPTVLLCCWIDGRQLYIPKAIFGNRIETRHMPRFFEAMPTLKGWPAIADSARPEMISHMVHNGYPKMRGAKKGKGSVEAGIEFLQNYRIVVDPQNKELIDEFSLYSYKTDARTGLVMPVLEDKNNHGIDALRYAVEPIMRKRPTLRARSSR